MSVRLTHWQRLRTRAFLFAIGVKRHMTLGVRVALIDGESIFLIRQTYMPGWQLPGGGVEPGEAAEYSAARELEEESGYRPAGPMSLFGLYHNVNSTTNRDHVALYLCREFERVRTFAANSEIAEAGWFPIDALPEQSGPGTRQRVQEIFHGAAQRTLW
jgi:ADP-ribose pyrophosphatase YjhB (NUDIX family)